MSTLIAYSQKDVAGSNMAEVLVDEYGFTDSGRVFQDTPVYSKGGVALAGFRDSLLYADRLPGSPDVCIVASRHKSESGKPTLTCHCTGNYGDADYGGRDHALGVAPALYLNKGLDLLREKQREYGLKHKVSFEVTHHGPTLDTPLLFMEVGSSMKEWSDMNACRAVASTIAELAFKPPREAESGIGFGGPHYAPNFSKTRKPALGHIMPKYALKHLEEDMFRQMMEKTTPKPSYCVLDWKGMRSREKRLASRLAEKHGLKVVRTSNLK